MRGHTKDKVVFSLPLAVKILRDHSVSASNRRLRLVFHIGLLFVAHQYAAYHPKEKDC